MDNKQIIGKAEVVSFPELGIESVYARIDTGAKTSAIWVSNVTETDKGLDVTFFDKGSDHFTGKPVRFKTYSETDVASSNGAVERRYKVRMLISIGDRRIRASFTLADRSTQVYPILVGRNVLSGKFIVDVSIGTTAMLDDKKRRSMARQNEGKK